MSGSAGVGYPREGKTQYGKKAIKSTKKEPFKMYY